MSTNNPTVAQYAVARLAALGIDHVFGVPGDYSFPIDGAIESQGLEWVVNAHERNAGARSRQISGLVPRTSISD